MKIAPVSGDLLLKAALVIGAAAVLAYVVRKASGAAADAAGAAWNNASQAVNDAAWAVAPWNNENVAYQTVNNAIWPDESETLGTWLYGVTHPEPEPTQSPEWHTGEGRWNNPSAYTAEQGGTTPGYSGSGGAAFGIYRRWS